MNLAQITNLNVEQAREYIEKIIWEKGAVCPHCGCKKVYKNKGKSARNGLYDCSECKKQFTVTVGTIMQGSHLKLRQWAIAFHLLLFFQKRILCSPATKKFRIRFIQDGIVYDAQNKISN